MKDREPCWFTGLWICLLLTLGSSGGTAAESVTNLAAQEKEACIQNLKVLYAAVQAFQADKQDLPNWLSDLVPQYVQDATLLVCPVCRRTGKTEAAPLADPNLPSSYLFEFCPLPLGSIAPDAANRTRREWKRRQMGLLGSSVPLIRCRFHTPVLNVAFDGKIFESPGKWELAFTNRVREQDLEAGKLFAGEVAQTNANQKPAPSYPKRDPKAGKQLIDLTSKYNVRLNSSWLGGTNNDLASLPTGRQTLGGVEFDVRGLLQLGSRSVTNFPQSIKALPAKQKCRKLHFLHAAAFGSPGEEGKQIGSYTVRYATSQMQLEIPIVYGKAVRDWRTLKGESESTDLKVAWTGENATSKREGRSLRLFLTTWTNLVPDVEISTIDFSSSMSGAAPLLIAVSAE